MKTKWGTEQYLRRNSVMMERFGGCITAPMKRTTFGCRSLRIIHTLYYRKNKKINNAGQWFWILSFIFFVKGDDVMSHMSSFREEKTWNKKIDLPHNSCHAIPFYRQRPLFYQRVRLGFAVLGNPLCWWRC